MAAAEPQPAAGPAAGPQPGAEEIDMSLDDIIKRHRKEQTDASTTGDSRRQQVKNRSSAPGYGRPRYGAWKQRNLQGPNRFRRGFGQQQFSRRQFRNTLPGRKRRAAAAFDGVSPLNRQASAQEGNKKSNAFAKSTSGQQEEQPQPSPGPKRFRADATSIRTRTPGRRWQVKPSPGAILTVSVVNPQAGHTSAPGSKRPFLRSQRPPARVTKPQPKGVLLRFNFRAMANQGTSHWLPRSSSFREWKGAFGLLQSQYLQALDFLHLNQVIHRDLKNSSILLGMDSTVKWSDHSQGQLTPEQDQQSSMVSTAHQLAPEVVSGSPCGPKVDIWSFGGTVTQQWVEGEPPYFRQTVAMIRNHNQYKPQGDILGLLERYYHHGKINNFDTGMNWANYEVHSKCEIGLGLF
ncbi:UAP56-interacting factor-like isoform X2 [Turdus rufiventris]|nr:UAP56-interacting factor-like isoform X2 [Turdus rufiventris]